jgi:hypothetical protein
MVLSSPVARNHSSATWTTAPRSYLDGGAVLHTAVALIHALGRPLFAPLPALRPRDAPPLRASLSGGALCAGLGYLPRYQGLPSKRGLERQPPGSFGTTQDLPPRRHGETTCSGSRRSCVRPIVVARMPLRGPRFLSTSKTVAPSR